MLLDHEEASIQSDAYIEALLEGHARRPIRIQLGGQLPPAGVRHVIRVLESGLPRFHPSFLVEERLAAELRAAAALAHQPALAVDRRLLMGGALASGVSLAGAAMLVWRRRRD